MKKEKHISIVTILLVVVCIISMSAAGLKTADYLLSGQEYKDLMGETPKVTQEAENTDMYPELDLDVQKLRAINGDLRYVLYFPHFDMLYPVVYPGDNNEYLHKTFEGKKLFAGCLFMNANGGDNLTDRNTIIYGHNMLDGSMFGKFKDLVQGKDRLKDPEYFYLYSENQVHRYRVVSYYKTKLQDGAYRIPTDDEEYDSFAENIKERSLQEFKTDLQTRPDIVTLSTCYGYGHQYFTVIHGALDKTFQIPATKTAASRGLRGRYASMAHD